VRARACVYVHACVRVCVRVGACMCVRVYVCVRESVCMCAPQQTDHLHILFVNFREYYFANTILFPSPV